MAYLPPIHPRFKDARAYERALRVSILDPFVSDVERRIQAAHQSYEAIRQNIAHIHQNPAVLIRSGQEAERHILRLHRHHTNRFERQMRKYFGTRVDVLAEGPVGTFMERAIRENVDLIRTINVKYHDKLKDDLAKLARERPFDQAAIRKVLRTSYGSAGYNLRRLTRDQTNKTIGKLSEIRQTQVGITQYIWVTSEDERVRESHEANSGVTFSWDDPPIRTGHPGNDIQCRCVPQGIIPPVPQRLAA